MKFSFILLLSLYILAHFSADANLLRTKQDAVNEHEDKRVLNSYSYSKSSKGMKGKGALFDP